jgi:small subunit ribosomal protein S6
MTVFSPDVPEDEIQGTIDRVISYITTATGEVVDVNRDSPWGRRRLAYPIRHASRDVRDGFYTLYHFSVAPDRVEDIERELRLNDRVMRHLVTQYTPRPVDETAQAGETTETADTAAAEVKPASASAEVASLSVEVEQSSASAVIESPTAEVEPADVVVEGELETEDVEPVAAEETETAATTESVEDAPEEVEPTASVNDEAGAEKTAPPEEE